MVGVECEAVRPVLPESAFASEPELNSLSVDRGHHGLYRVSGVGYWNEDWKLQQPRELELELQK